MDSFFLYGMLSDLINVIVPIGTCVILPICICFIVSRTRRNYDNKKSEIILKAIEANPTVDPDKLIASLSRPQRSPEQVRQRYLLIGCIGTILGVVGIIVTKIATIQAGNTSDALIMYYIAGAISAVGLANLIVYFVSGKSGKSE